MTRRICISGASSGIGARIAVDLAREGHHLTLLARRQNLLDEVAEQARAAGATSVTPLAVDLTVPEQVRPVLEQAGRFDVVVAAAGANAALAADAQTHLKGMAWAAWHWEANFRANVLSAVTLLEGLRELDALAEGASIVLLSSIAAYRGSGSGSYGGSKAALHPYAYDLAAALGPQGIRVNVVAPGYIAETNFFQGQMSEQRHETLVGQTLIGRAGMPDDVSETVRWLTSAGARHVTGQIIQVNGGASLGH
ncbi:SDR family NAD(P)-dependent oxidoreductase [Kineosporia babensis]|uniref:SDR family oxidoreductase n=1 Tax=Kineosporia babensis TaxID=499548 RepID=A0A9X1STJ3_9ACTN|nr:SDR family oxidoreductase [Kineosporia babensis]MCD5311949.1 SDR family oxidoreductase [Kineosporia babensis]